MNRTPLIVAIVLLLLPGLYVGCYFAMLRPRHMAVVNFSGGNAWSAPSYRFQSRKCALVFWPLQELDRKVRPDRWKHGPFDDHGRGIETWQYTPSN